MPNKLSVSERIYHKLLLIYPKQFRERYGREMLILFRNLYRERKGATHNFELWAHLIIDLAATAPLEYVSKEAEMSHLISSINQMARTFYK